MTDRYRFPIRSRSTAIVRELGRACRSRKADLRRKTPSMRQSPGWWVRTDRVPTAIRSEEANGRSVFVLSGGILPRDHASELARDSHMDG